MGETMEKTYFVLMSLVIVLGSISGCSTKKDQFSDENILFNVINTQTNSEFRSYTIEVSNDTGFDLSHLSFSLSYPIKISNGLKGNPFAIKGITDDTVRPVNLSSGETISYTIFAPINEVFGKTDTLDFENPSVELNGYVKEGDEEVPFGIIRGMSGLVNP